MPRRFLDHQFPAAIQCEARWLPACAEAGSVAKEIDHVPGRGQAHARTLLRSGRPRASSVQARGEYRPGAPGVEECVRVTGAGLAPQRLSPVVPYPRAPGAVDASPRQPLVRPIPNSAKSVPRDGLIRMHPTLHVVKRHEEDSGAARNLLL